MELNKTHQTTFKLIYRKRSKKNMATSDQAKKRVRQNNKTRARQKGQGTLLRTKMAKVETAITENADNQEEVLSDALKAIDKAASKGLIHKNKAARDKSRLQKKVNAN